MSEHTLHLVICKGRWYSSVLILRVVKKAPKLKAGEVAVKITLEIPFEVLEPKVVPLTITKDNIIHPPVTVKQT